MARPQKTQEFEVQGLIFETPDRPKSEDILNHDLPKRKQKWHRFEYTEEDYESWSPKKKQDYVKTEYDRILNGYWFFNNGFATYITGIHYLYLQWFVMDDGNYPQYRDTDKRFFYFWRCIELMLWCLGMIYTKYRRQGASARGACISLYYSLTNTNILNGTISKTGQDSKDIFQMMIVNGYTNLPSWLKPRTSGFDRASKELYMNEVATRQTKDKQVSGKSTGLNNRINWLPTALNSYDSKAVKFLFLDEGAKWKECSVREYWPIAQKCLTKGSRRYGLAYLPSTINEMEKGGGKEFHAIWKNSDHMSKDFNGRTASGLVKFFLPSYDGFEGFIDEYGESVIDPPTPQQFEYLRSTNEGGLTDNELKLGAKGFQAQTRARLKDDPDALSAEKRQNPWTEQEAFRTSAATSHFNVELINTQKERIEAGEGPMVRRVTFYRKSDGTVDWVDDPNGRWQLIWDFKNKEQANKHYFSRGKKRPGNVDKFGAGGDPFSHTITLGKGSQGVFYVYRKYDVLDPDNSDMPIVRYAGRPKLKSIFFDDAMMTCEYFGCQIGFEEINDEFYERFKEKGLDEYLIWTPEFMVSQTKRIKKKPGIPGTGIKAIEAHLRLLVEHVIQNWRKIWFIEALDDFLDFDVLDRTPFDDTMAYGYTLIACSEEMNRKVAEPPKQAVLKRYVIKR